MKSFLAELVEQLDREKLSWDQVTLIFPNRRASLYFKKYLSEVLTKPTFAPRLITIEEFIGSLSSWRVPDKLELVYRLYEQYAQTMPATFSKQSDQAEPFDRFYFWGEMLLRDFEEIDKYLVNAEQLFKDLSQQKELDASFDFLTDEQKEFLKKFWFGFEDSLTDSKQKFLTVWRKLFSLYEQYRISLQKDGLAYEGMIHRDAAEKIHELTLPEYGQMIFVAFNALTAAEEKIVSWLVQHRNARVIWDADQYYVNDKQQEAGSFLREYQAHSVLKETFTDFPANFVGPKNVQLISAAQNMGQAKYLSQLLEQHLADGALPEDTLIVLPDEKMLIPVLHGISDKIDKLNVTMGFSLTNTPVFILLEQLVELQHSKSFEHFHHRQVLALLSHPYLLVADAALANAKRKEILSHNWVSIPQTFLATHLPLHRLIFQPVNGGLISYLRDIIYEIASLKGIADLDREFLFQFLTLLNRMAEVMGDAQNVDQPKAFLRLFRQVVKAQKIPFSGEPLKGLQIMGVLETRNLDFKHVFILSLNEGAFPSFGSKGSYVPYHLRKAYRLPTVEHQDAIYSYLFYRVIQRAENVFLMYNSETDPLGQGEMSRYLQQLVFESPLKLARSVIHNSVQPRTPDPIVIHKSESVLALLARLNEGNAGFRGISPTALTTYLECSLKFYFRHIVKVREAKVVEEDLDARVLGNFVHKVMEKFYKQAVARRNDKTIEADDFVNKELTIERLIDQEFISVYRLDPHRTVTYEGQRLIVREVVKRFALAILTADERYAPFSMEALEQAGLLYSVKISHAPGFVVLGGTIDRIDRKGNRVRIIDYKTGKDSLKFKSIEELFIRTKPTNKAAFQVLMYALLYRHNHSIQSDDRIIPGLINRTNLFDDDAAFGLEMDGTHVGDVSALLPEFEARLRELLEEIYSPDGAFVQTTLVEKCKNCPYQQICYR